MVLGGILQYLWVHPNPQHQHPKKYRAMMSTSIDAKHKSRLVKMRWFIFNFMGIFQRKKSFYKPKLKDVFSYSSQCIKFAFLS